MATRTIVICDACQQEIHNPSTMVEFSAGLYATGVAVEKFDVSQFCGRSCVIAAVNALLNGKP